MTLERLAKGIGQLTITVQRIADDRDAALLGRIDRLAGRLDELAGLLGEVLAMMPRPARWCAPWLSDDGDVYCEGGYKLARSKMAKGAPRKKEWMHPLPEGQRGYSWNPETEAWVESHWHGVWESVSLKSPPPEGERAGPERPGSHDLDDGGDEGGVPF